MGAIKQMHIDCTPEECLAPAEFKHTCYAGTDMDVEPTEPSEPVDGSDRDNNIDMDRE